MSIYTKHFDSLQAVDETAVSTKAATICVHDFRYFWAFEVSPKVLRNTVSVYIFCPDLVSERQCSGKFFVQIHYYFVATNLSINYLKQRIGNSFMCFCHDECIRN